MFMSESYSIAALLGPACAAATKLAAMKMKTVKIVLFILVEVTLGIRHDYVRSGFACQCVSDRGCHLYIAAVARNNPPPVGGGNQIKRYPCAGRHDMWTAGRCA